MICFIYHPQQPLQISWGNNPRAGSGKEPGPHTAAAQACWLPHLHGCPYTLSSSHLGPRAR